MCLIVDVNIAHKVFLVDNDPDFSAVHEALFSDKKVIARIVYSSELIKECKNHEIIRKIAELDRAGRARSASDADVEKEKKVVIQTGLCKSNDTHIIALARVSKVRLLCSHDKPLATDFKNKDLIKKPRGKVYKNSKHSSLLYKFCG